MQVAATAEASDEEEKSGRNFLKEVPPRTPPQELSTLAGT
ncbi:hypothetical protein Desti_1567 [Desulfomonile tiedjei DSM 6799]|uniref:Uncharacterized protein n=1 Tax=Desulfomonile tiedjei (strain ATCC 49306 / DSM 6799 / DCB-1) TaxID=706587 RepID=I4C3Y7_DESTA|nr:hypothetical protein Desti_1567 [Desulfomonile tiedjei DSM 6799]